MDCLSVIVKCWFGVIEVWLDMRWVCICLVVVWFGVLGGVV